MRLVKELNENNHVLEVPIFKQFHKFVIGKGGVNIKKVSKEEKRHCNFNSFLYYVIMLFRYEKKHKRKLIYLRKVKKVMLLPLLERKKT